MGNKQQWREFKGVIFRSANYNVNQETQVSKRSKNLKAFVRENFEPLTSATLLYGIRDFLD